MLFFNTLKFFFPSAAILLNVLPKIDLKILVNLLILACSLSSDFPALSANESVSTLFSSADAYAPLPAPTPLPELLSELLDLLFNLSKPANAPFASFADLAVSAIAPDISDVSSAASASSDGSPPAEDEPDLPNIFSVKD